ncbi:MAG: DUF4446 family protein [Candidatus Moranbacteria bacterium]|nr:DUF4446 family protein [Candidatus Moranbacteria bacterium]
MELFSTVFLSIIGFLLVLGNILFWKKIKALEKTVGMPNGSLHPSLKAKKLDKDVQDLYEINSQINKVARRGICKVGVVKFNALGEKSGNQSFSVALLNFNDTGLVVSYLQTAQGLRSYIRQIHKGEEQNGASLLPEEKKALERAKQVVFDS